MSEKIKLSNSEKFEFISVPSSEEVEFILEQIQKNYLDLLKHPKIQRILNNRADGSLSRGHRSKLRKYRKEVNKIYEKLSKINLVEKEEKAEDEFMSRRLYEINLKALSTLSALVKKITSSRRAPAGEISGREFTKYKMLAEIFPLASKCFFKLIQLTGIKLRKEKGKESAKEWLKENYGEKKNTRSYRELIESIEESENPGFKENTYEGFRENLDELKEKIERYEESYGKLKERKIGS